MIIINTLKFTHKKTTLEFIENSNDPIKKEIVYDTLPETVQSHIDAVALFMVEDTQARYAEAQKQMPLGFENPDEEETKSSDPTVFDEDPATDPFDDTDYKDIKVPFHDGTHIPDLRGMERLHAEWYVRQYEDKGELINDFKYCYDANLKDNLDLLSLQRQAMTILQGKK